MPATDEFGGHEVLHTAYLIQDLFNREVVDHGYVIARRDLVLAAEKVSEALGDFYQLVGQAAGEGVNIDPPGPPE